MRTGRVSDRHVRDLLRDKGTDVSRIEPFLFSEDPMVRRMAARVVGPMGNLKILLKAALEESERSTLLEMLKQLGGRKQGLEGIVGFLSNTDPILKDSAIDMFRRAGDKDSLFVLLFDEDEVLAQRIKRYLDEQEGGEGTRT
jgi:hypothetical protein